MGEVTTKRRRGAMVLRIILTILLVSVMLPSLSPTRALGAPPPPSSISGIFHLEKVIAGISRHYGWVELDGGYEAVYFSGSFVCTSSNYYNTWDNTGSYNPGVPTYWGTFTARLNYVDEANQRAYYYVEDEMVLPRGVSHWGNTQNLGRGDIAIAWDFPKGHVSLSKTSVLSDMTQGNPCYSLAGAEYGVYAENGTYIGTIVTDEFGYGSLEKDLDFGHYFLKELKAPLGYRLDDREHWVELTEENPNATVSVADIPIGDPELIMLQKTDSEIGSTYNADELPQGSASLAGAEYTVRYYQAFYDTVAEAQVATPARTWVIKTDASGHSILADKAFVSGDSFYRNQTGDPVIPFGTITVVETKAPEGYVLPKPGDSNYKVFLTRYVPDSSEPGGIRIEGDMNGVQQGNEPKHREQVMRGDIELTKYMRLYEPDRVVETGAAKPEPRAIFDFYASRDFTGTRPTDGAAPAFWLQTDEEGRASTIDAGIYLIQNPNGSYELRPRPADATGGLPYDSYLCVQRTTDPAYQMCEPLIFTVNQDGMLATTELYDDAVSSAIRVVKVDAETGEVIAYPASWQIYSQQTNRYVKMDDGKGMTDTFRSDDNGQLPLPEALPYGSYLLHEVEAPRDARVGYVLNTTDLPFFVTEVRDIDNPLVITAKDVPAKGTIGLSKTGSRRGAPVAGAEYAVIARSDISTLDGTLRAAAGETVAVLVTDEQGKAVSAPLYLGDYLVVETRAPKGYQKDETEYPVELLYEGQQVAVVEAHLNLKDDETTIEGWKRERKTEKPIPDTEFTLYREREAGSDVWEPVDVLLTDADGKAVFSPVMPGSYKLVETRPNPSYASCEESGEKGTRYLTIDENSTSEVQIFYNTKIQLGCEIYEDTINVTAAAFKTNDEDYLRVENVGAESYHYTLDFRSTSNVRADEFTVIDRLESVITGSVRLKEVFTPVARGDSDGFFNLWYQTNLTDSSRLYSSANAMSSNPFNANNPNKRQNWPSVGWKLWQENIPTTVTTRLLVDDLGLAQGEYVTALRFEYGSVEVGFTTRDTVKQALQNSKESKPLTSDWSTDSQADNKDSNGEANKDSLSSLAVPNLKPATYLVICSTALLPPTTIRDSAIVHIARNIVLSDEDVDAVETRVIEPFMTKTTPTVPTDLTTLTGFEKPGPSRLPSTGDHATYQALMAVLSFALLSAVFLHRAGVRRSPRRGRHFLDKSSVSNGG